MNIGIIIAIACLTLAALGILCFQVYSMHHFDAQLKAIDNKVSAIQWPIKGE